MGVSWHSNIPALWDHSDVRSDIAEHVRVIGMVKRTFPYGVTHFLIIYHGIKWLGPLI